jgi:Cu+-exporting ATPase
MDRRNFIRVTTATTTAAGLGVASAAAPKESKSVQYKINGFTCITCAVGLEVMLKGMKGVTRVTASYPENSVTIGFDEHVTTEKTLKEFISVCGFSVAPKT